MDVVYFNQRLGAAHSKCWLKYSFLGIKAGPYEIHYEQRFQPAFGVHSPQMLVKIYKKWIGPSV